LRRWLLLDLSLLSGPLIPLGLLLQSSLLHPLIRWPLLGQLLLLGLLHLPHQLLPLGLSHLPGL